MRRITSLLVLALILSAACGEELVRPAAATVRSDKIPTSEVETTVEEFKDCKAFDQIASQQGGPGPTTRLFEQSVLSQLIRVEVLRPPAEEREIEVTDQDVQQRIEQIKGQFPSEQAFNQQLASQCLTLDQVEELVKAGLLEEKLRAEAIAGTSVPEEELRSHYEQNRGDYDLTEVQHILVKKKLLVNDLSRQLRAAPAKRVDGLLAQLARKHSTDKSNANDAGRLGLAPPGQFVPEFESAMNDLSIGAISQPVKSQFGYHVIRVTDRKSQSFEQVRAQIEEQLAGPRQDQEWETWIRDAFDDADVEVNPRYGEFDVGQQRVVNATA
ncbi:MAG: peptidylprolyl isomerase, partial [Actinomycetota bacterium]